MTAAGAPDRLTTVGVLGAGQLGRMLALAGVPLGVRFRFFDPAPDPCAGWVGEHVRGNWHDGAALDRFAEGLDHLTWEFENVPVDAVEHLRARVPSTPSSRSLFVAQDRLREKRTFAELGLGTAPFAPADTEAELAAALRTLGGPAIVKTRRGGYDGKGQATADGPGDAARVWAELRGAALIVEGRVAFDRELSIIATRGRGGAVVTAPVSWNVHQGGILRRSIAPAPALDPVVAAAAVRIGRDVITALDHVGTLCVELFQVGERLLCNELAPRVHNSGHWTIEGARTSQFENHVRAVVGLPLGDPGMAHPAAGMANWIGAVPDVADIRDHWAHPHVYGKAPRPGRKVGHLTVTGPSASVVGERLA